MGEPLKSDKECIDLMRWEMGIFMTFVCGREIKESC